MNSDEQRVDREQRIATQTHGSTFRWPRGLTLTAVDEVILVLPGAVVADNDRIETAFDASEDLEMKLELASDGKTLQYIYLHLQANMWVTSKKTCDAMVLASDGMPKRLKMG